MPTSHRRLLRDLAQAVRVLQKPLHVDCTRVTFFGAHGLRIPALSMRAAPSGRLTELSADSALDLVLKVFPAATFTGPTAA